ncbi:PspC domain-containing protein [Limosilactobacillus secaliphilus]|uniref:PspC domain-containing protein n=1 Tax=Limosilactobacillus secaliphilus TaxID=396268 RepID=UPI0007092952|nr:PspC domain-containing protein [Limosilactobacillus secaliphilus]
MREERRNQRRLKRSSTDRKLAGVFGGLGHYLHVNSNFLRVAYLILTALTTIVPGILIYIMLAITIPADNPGTDLLTILRHLGGKTESKPQRKELHDVEEHDIKK